MRRTYIVETIYKGGVKKEKKVLESSQKCWLRNAFLDEGDGCVVSIIFKYSTKKDIFMTSYSSFSVADGYEIKVYLQKNKKGAI